MTNHGPKPSSSSERRAGDGLRVLIVENDRDSLDAFATLLQLEGIDVVAVDSAGAALDLLFEGPLPAVIVLDVWTPGMSALEFLHEKAGAPAPVAAIPVIAVSGDAQALDALVDHDAGGALAATLRKPFDIDELVALVRAARPSR